MSAKPPTLDRKAIASLNARHLSEKAKLRNVAKKAVKK